MSQNMYLEALRPLSFDLQMLIKLATEIVNSVQT